MARGWSDSRCPGQDTTPDNNKGPYGDEAFIDDDRPKVIRGKAASDSSPSEACLEPPVPLRQIPFPPLSFMSPQEQSFIGNRVSMAASVFYTNENHELRTLNLLTGEIRTLLQASLVADVRSVTINGRPSIAVIRLASGRQSAVDFFAVNSSAIFHFDFWGYPCSIGDDGMWVVAWDGRNRQSSIRRIAWDASVTSPWIATPSGTCTTNGAGHHLIIWPVSKIQQANKRVVVIDTRMIRMTEFIGEPVVDTVIVSNGETEVISNSQAFAIRNGKAKTTRTFQTQPDMVLLSATINPDGNRLAALLKDKEADLNDAPAGLIVVNLQSGDQQTFAMPHNGSLHWSPDGTKILVGLPDGFLVFDPLDPGTEARTAVVVPDRIPFGRIVSVVGLSG